MRSFKSLVVFSILLSACAPKQYNQLSWQQKEVTPDGNISDWAVPLRFFDSKSKLNFTITNDRKNLYVCIKAADDVSQAKIVRNGMIFGIDTSGKKSFPITLSFPVPGEKHMMKNRGQHGAEKEEGHEERSDVARKQERLAKLKELHLSGFSVPMNSLPLSNPYGIFAAINVDQNDVMVCELVIPFKTFYKEELSPSDVNKVFNYQIKVNGTNIEHNGGGNQGGGGMSGGGMGGGMGGGGMGGGGMRGGGGMGGGGRHGGGGGAAVASNPMNETDVVTLKAKFSYE